MKKAHPSWSNIPGDNLNQKAEFIDKLIYKATEDKNRKACFQSIYIALTGKKYGPRASVLMLSTDKNKVIGRFREASNSTQRR